MEQGDEMKLNSPLGRLIWPPELGLSAPTRVRALSGAGVSPFFLRVSPCFQKKKKIDFWH
jgi:hypothetical protein